MRCCPRQTKFIVYVGLCANVVKCGSVVKTAKYMVNNCFALRAFLFAEKLICCRRNRVTEHGCRSVWNVRQKIYETSRGSKFAKFVVKETK